MSTVIRDIYKSFGSFQALAGVDLGVEMGELVALLGPSGSEKTTLLRIIAGLAHAPRGGVLPVKRDAARIGVLERGSALFFSTTHSLST